MDHTPTPWKLANEDDENMFGEVIGTSILNADGYAIAETSATAVRHNWDKEPGAQHWATDPNGFIDLAEGEAEANAAFIVQAVNSHDDLVAMLAEVKERGLIYWEPNTARGHETKAAMLAKIDALLAKTGGA